MQNNESNIEVPLTTEEIRDKIKHTLTIYPRLSMTMLQVGIGTYIGPNVWKPILFQMIEDKIVLREHVSAETPKGRMQTYTVLRLATTV